MLKNGKLLGFPARFHPTVVLRTPRFPYRELGSARELLAAYRSPAFREAVGLASPTLRAEVDKLVAAGGDPEAPAATRLLSKLHKYWVRASARTTPFGLFAGCSCVDWTAEATDIQIGGPAEIRRYTRLDLGFLCRCVGRLLRTEAIRAHLPFYPNESLHRVGNQLKYVEYAYRGSRRVYQLTAAEADVYLDRVLAAAVAGALPSELGRALTDLDPEIAPEEARAFVDQLIDGQLLRSGLEPGGTGGDPLQQVMAALERIADRTPEAIPPLDRFREIHHHLGELDRGGGSPEAYRSVYAAIDALGVPYERGKIFHVSMDKTHPERPRLGRGLQRRLLEATEVLLRMSPHENHYLRDFSRAFHEKYGDREVPLLAALDPETGLGFPVGNARPAPNAFTDGIGHAGAAASGGGTITYTARDRRLHGVLAAAQHERPREVDLETLLRDLPPDTGPAVPPTTLNVRFSVNGGADAGATIFVRPAGFPSAINLLGRFAETNGGIARQLADVAAFEAESCAPAVLAEIVHLPQERDGNVAQHPPFRAYEIPYLGTASVDEAHRIAVSDLTISLVGERIVLRSVRLDREVIPTLSCAHNYGRNTLPVYHFLAALHFQRQRTRITFNWGGFEELFSYFPRVVYRGVVLQCARWHLGAAELGPLLALPPAGRPAALRAWRDQLGLPRRIAVLEGDQELPLDLDNPFAAATFLAILRKKKTLVLQEFPFTEATAIVRDAGGNVYPNEFFATVLVDKPPAAAAPVRRAATAPEVQRRFTLGSEWLYYKVYCAPTLADRLLTTVLAPLLTALTEEGSLTAWFFIRYYDPDSHLRVRLRLTDPAALGSVVRRLEGALRPYVADGRVQTLQTDVYVRELERYGSNTIALCETWFWIDSRSVVRSLAGLAETEDENARWWLAIGNVDRILTDFGLDLPRKLALIATLRDNFRREFGISRDTSRRINLRYRNFRRQIAATVEDDRWRSHDADGAERAATIGHLTDVFARGENELPLDQLLASLLHMHLNRYFSENQRFQEFMVYTMLEKYYRSAAVVGQTVVYG